jgi:hypothetical protein
LRVGLDQADLARFRNRFRDVSIEAAEAGG